MSLRFEESLLMREKMELDAKLKKLRKDKNDDRVQLPKTEQARLDEINELLKKKIISVTMTQSLVNHIDDLVKERAGRSRAQMIEDSVRWFLDFTVHKWNERGIYVNTSRAVFESEAISSLFFSKLTPSDQYDLGITAGGQSPIADVVRLIYGESPENVDSRGLVLNLLQDNGWGSISINEQGLIVIGSPFYPAPFIRGYLESLFKTKLKVVETNVKENVALQVVK
ncbi:MAG: ribbon-helix-helix domain-containing protein [Candidatus Thorarchaeota archaeon]|nr:ribbon-helix-helix domain-containing protein [Candidatus Thorarchaeota archaeon]